jgi:hypothetical protein
MSTSVDLASEVSPTISTVVSSGSGSGSYTYDPYGDITNTLNATAAANPFRYTGAYQAAASLGASSSLAHSPMT